MAFHKDFDFVVEGNVIAYRQGRRATAAALPPNQGLSLHFGAIEGKIAIRVSALDRLHPFRTRVVGGHVDPDAPDEGPGSIIEEFNSVASVLELFPPGQHTPVKRLVIHSGFSRIEIFELEHIVTSPAPKGEWELRLSNKDKKAAKVDMSVVRFIDREPLHTTFLAHRLLDHAYLVVLEALQPRARISGKTVAISFGEELREFLGDGDSGPLGTHVFKLPDGRISFEGEGHLNSFDVRATSGRTLLDAVLARWQEVKDSTHGSDKLEENNKFRHEWEQRVQPDDAVIHASAAFTDITVVAAADLGLFDVDARGVITKAMVDVYIAFDRNLLRCDVLALSPLKFVPTDFEAALLDELGVIPELNNIVEEILPQPIESAGREVGRFMGEALGGLATRDSVFHSVTANDTHWLVRYTSIPSDPTLAGVGPLGGVHGHDGTHGPVGGGGSGGGGGTADPGDGGGPGPTPDPSLGVLPPPDQFIVVKPETLPRLDKIDHLVFVMMENRSFDHILGYLRAARGPQYEGLHGTESNRVEGRTLPVRMHRAREIVPDPVTQIPLSPRHDFKPVERQINDGAMSGFGQDFEDRHPGFAELVMTFYSAEELKVYDRLAADYCVCDHWYCAHAGPTFPNRFVTLSGLTPALDNFAVDDPILGFLPERTIFDMLTERGIAWAVFESDLSVIRMFNHFRLNADEVRPYINREDPNQSFAEVAKRGELPQVVFVEPNFVDIPPIETATDDHPPADLRRGQNFITEVVRALAGNREHWQRTMLAITYDEHGGFFDHIPPPGTSLGNPEFIGKIPRVHPDGQDFMGPRVPSFVVSPFVSAGAVCKDVLDHTSIIKTILLRHREKIPTEVFTQFGPRVNMIAHLGVALDLDQPRPDAPPRLERMRIEREPANPAARADFLAKLGSPEPDDFHQSLRRAALPKHK